MPLIWVPTGVGRSDFVEKKSRFIGEARAVESAKEARSLVSGLREEHPRSNHVVWAYVLGADGSLKGLSDDGEPHGTAGRPVLDPIVGSGLTNTLVTVVRYFGGVKLGTGGLVSAYSRSCREALEIMGREELVFRIGLSLEIEYPLYEPVGRQIRDFKVLVENEDFGSRVRLELKVPLTALEAFRRSLTDLSRGTAIMEVSEETGK